MDSALGPLHQRASSLWAPKNSVESERRKRRKGRREVVEEGVEAKKGLCEEYVHL